MGKSILSFARAKQHALLITARNPTEPNEKTSERQLRGEFAYRSTCRFAPTNGSLKSARTIA